LGGRYRQELQSLPMWRRALQPCTSCRRG
jgi:hypothetical protein